MSVWKGNRIEVEIYGDSHSEEIGARIVGFPDIAVDESALNAHLSRRKSGIYIGSTARKEADIPLLSYEKAGEIVVAFQNQDIRK